MSPRNVLTADAVRRAGHAPGPVKEVDENSPERHKEPAPFREVVVARTALLTGGAFAAESPVGVNPHLDPRHAVRASQADAVIHKADKRLDPVQEGLNLQLSGGCFFIPDSTPNRLNDLPLIFPPARSSQPRAHACQLKRAERRLPSPSSRRAAVEVVRLPFPRFLPANLSVDPWCVVASDGGVPTARKRGGWCSMMACAA